ncbi:reprolysin-like metallopeptidase [Chryseobacterium kwangjuense]|uniref:Reprolysin-like metallopeptidase n=1 Tax=Chryseobacterium kwangjuense TaxID=267125 RepID=A0ABW9K742_9FLAO
MKKQLLMAGMLMITGITFAQTDRLWSKTSLQKSAEVVENKTGINNPKIFSLDINGLKTALSRASERSVSVEKSDIIISFPNAEGKMENFRVAEHSNLAPELSAKYPDIKSYVGQNTTDPGSTVYFSLSELGLSSMEIYGDKSAVFIEPYTKDLSTYVVYKKSDRKDNLNTFECTMVDEVQKASPNASARPNADDAKLRTYRMALSCTGEYTTYFGGTKANALAAMNNTMTRVNGVFEKDMAIRMVLIANNDAIIYTNSATDPYSPAASKDKWNLELQNNLTANIGNSAYDIGHLFGATGGGGNSGCLACVCVDDTSSLTDRNKGSAITSPGNGVPSGDTFDIDYVAHEIGHQFGANHTYSFKTDGDVNTVRMEPGSGSTIMGYAGITSQDVQPNSDPFFHASSIQQVTNYAKSTSCAAITNTGNAIPTANAGLDYTIPKGTPFMLTGTGTDANGDILTYIWEQIDSAPSSQTGTSSAASATKTSGPTFRSWVPTASPVRYFPKMSSILTGSTTTAGSEITVEALSNVARKLNFRFTVRDNRAGGSGNNSDDVVITVNKTAGPFTVSSQNSATTYTGGSSQTVTWNVAGTTTNGVNAANVDILWSTDSGNTWTTLLTGTPNDGTQAISIPNSSTTTGRIMVKGSNHIFFDVNNANIKVNVSAGKVAQETRELASGIKIHPNPVQDILNVSNTTSEEYKIYDASGKIAASGKLERGTVNLSQLPKGNYLIQIGDTVKKFIKD